MKNFAVLLIFVSSVAPGVIITLDATDCHEVTPVEVAR